MNWMIYREVPDFEETVVFIFKTFVIRSVHLSVCHVERPAFNGINVAKLNKTSHLAEK